MAYALSRTTASAPAAPPVLASMAPAAAPGAVAPVVANSSDIEAEDAPTDVAAEEVGIIYTLYSRYNVYIRRLWLTLAR